MHFGFQNDKKIDKLEIHWQDGKYQEFSEVVANQLLNVDYSDAIGRNEEPEKSMNTIFTEVESDYLHIDPYFNDFDIQILLPHKLSQTGPAMAKADVNGDGIEDVFLGGGLSQPGQLLLGNLNGNFSLRTIQAFTDDKEYEDVGATFLDRIMMVTRIYM